MFIYVFAPLLLVVLVALVPAIVLAAVSRLDRRANWLDKKAAEAAVEAAAEDAPAEETAA